MADGALRKGGGASPRAQSRLLYPESGLSDFFAGKRFETGKARLPQVMASRLCKRLGSNIYIRI